MSHAPKENRSARLASGVKREDGSVPAAAASAPSPARAPDWGSELTRRDTAGGLIALVSRERSRQTVRDALDDKTAVHFVGRVEDLPSSIRERLPVAALVELADGESDLAERAAQMLKRLAPVIQVCAYIPPIPDTVRAAVRLAGRGLVTDVITIGENLGTRLEELLLRSRRQSENAALLDVWRDRVELEAYPILNACIEATAAAVTVADVARRLNKSPRALERQAARAGLPPVQRVAIACRLLRAVRRLERRDASVKMVASELGYPSAGALAQQLHRHTGLTMSSVRASGGFPALVALVRSELVVARDRARRRPHGATQSH